VILIIIGSINDILKTRYNNKKKTIYKSNNILFFIDIKIVHEFVVLLRDMATSYIQKRFIDQIIPDDEGDIQVYTNKNIFVCEFIFMYFYGYL
jgi:sRNA-binding regulator protein Hfq